MQFARDPVGMEAAQDSAKKTVYVSSIPASVTEDQLREHFGPFGTVVKVFVIKDRKTGKSREFGFVEYASVSLIDIAHICRAMATHLLPATFSCLEVLCSGLWSFL